MVSGKAAFAVGSNVSWGIGVFGFLIKGEVNDDAVRLKQIVDQALNKYGHLDQLELEETLRRDFPSDHLFIGRDDATFVHPNIEYFPCHLMVEPKDADARWSLSVHGRGKYAGFLLHASTRGWHCSVSDGIAYRATGGARKLARTMCKKFDVTDMDKLLKGFR